MQFQLNPVKETECAHTHTQQHRQRQHELMTSERLHLAQSVYKYICTYMWESHRATNERKWRRRSWKKNTHSIIVHNAINNNSNNGSRDDERISHIRRELGARVREKDREIRAVRIMCHSNAHFLCTHKQAKKLCTNFSLSLSFSLSVAVIMIVFWSGVSS